MEFMANESELDQLKNEIIELKAKLAHSEGERHRLEEENDLLALDNNELRDLLAAKASSRYSTATNPDEDGVTQKVTALEIFQEGDGQYVNHSQQRWDNACGGKNVIACAVFVSPDVNEMGDMIVSGGVDAVLAGFDVIAGVKVFSQRLSAPILCIDCCPPYIACGTMDGSLAILQFADLTDAPLLLQHKDHSKYVVSVAWAHDGKYLATASYDRFVQIYKQNELGSMEKMRTVQFQFTPECLSFAFTPYHSQALAPEENELIVGLRGVSYLVYLQVESGAETTVSMNEHTWDQHVSFTPLYLSVSPNRQYLLIATDNQMHFVLRLHSNQRLRVLSGHTAGAYSKPVAVWDHTGDYVYSNSEEDATLYVYSLCTEKICGKLRGHTGIVRGLCAHPHKALVATASYDKSVVLWNNSSSV